MNNKYKTFTYTIHGIEYEYEVSYYTCMEHYTQEYFRGFMTDWKEADRIVMEVMNSIKDCDFTTFVNNHAEELRGILEDEAIAQFEEEYFTCEDCGNVLYKDDYLCTEHGDNICKECCEKCRAEDAYWDNYNREVDLYMEDRYDD